MRRLLTLAFIGLVASSSFGCDQAAKKDEAKAEAPKETEKPAKTEEVKTPTEAKADAAASDLPLHAKGPVAKIDGKEITAAAFNKEVSRLKNIAARIPPQAVKKFKTNTVDRLIDQTLVEMALDKAKVAHTPAEVDTEMGEFMKSIGGDAGAERFFSQTGMTKDELKKDLVRSIQLKKYLAEKYKLDITDTAAKEFYDKNVKRFSEAEQVQASHILIKVEKDADATTVKTKKKAAMDVYKKAVKKGADFAKLASEFSEGPTAKRGGDLGFFTKNRMVPAFADAAFAAKVGMITKPVRTEFGFHVIKVVDHKDAAVKTFDEVKTEIKKNLERNGQRTSMETLIKELRAAVKIEKFEDNITENIKAPAAPMGMPGMPGMPGMGGHPPMPKGGAAPGAPTPAPKPAPKGK